MTPSEIILFIAKVSFEYDELPVTARDSKYAKRPPVEWAFKE
jgi:hypothetical protein